MLGALIPKLPPHALNLPLPRLVRTPPRSARRPALGRVTKRVHTYHMLHHGSVCHHDPQAEVLRNIRDSRAPRERVVVHARLVAIAVAAQLPNQTYKLAADSTPALDHAGQKLAANSRRQVLVLRRLLLGALLSSNPGRDTRAGGPAS